jgi:hypothetical protein
LSNPPYFGSGLMLPQAQVVNRLNDYEKNKVSAMPGLDPLAISRLGASYGNALFHSSASYVLFMIMMKNKSFCPRIL